MVSSVGNRQASFCRCSVSLQCTRCIKSVGGRSVRNARNGKVEGCTLGRQPARAVEAHYAYVRAKSRDSCWKRTAVREASAEANTTAVYEAAALYAFIG